MSDDATKETTTEVTETVTSTRAEISTDELAKARELVLSANPNVVPELVKGNSITELMESVGPAKSAFDAIAAKVKPADTTETKTTPEGGTVIVPAGGTNPAPAIDSLPTAEKIKRGLAARRSSS